jgi:hypothetical protein
MRRTRPSRIAKQVQHVVLTLKDLDLLHAVAVAWSEDVTAAIGVESAAIRAHQSQHYERNTEPKPPHCLSSPPVSIRT